MFVLFMLPFNKYLLRTELSEFGREKGYIEYINHVYSRLEHMVSIFKSQKLVRLLLNCLLSLLPILPGCSYKINLSWLSIAV